jgi:predicted unusual protein kinase regulating ubiquinone biosynthesis (AarF/ABC1/UbiB family)
MAEQNKIPTGKVQRAGKFIKTGVKVGANFAGHYMKKMTNRPVDEDELSRKNAEEIFNTLSQLKGSALKIAQMMSMDTGILPKAYAERFAAAQNSAMALSAPMVMNTFIKNFGKSPQQIFDKFNMQASFAASIGQVHEAYKDGQRLAVKVQYPGVADSIKSDIALVKPIILRIAGVSQNAASPYIEEIETRLIEETDYDMELHNGMEMQDNALHVDNIVVPKYYPELSNKRILTMGWLEGMSLNQFIQEEKDTDLRTKIGQSLLDFVHYQIHTRKRFHADLHPGNFLVTKDYQLGVLDFGCMKSLPEDFYVQYFSLAKPEVREDDNKLREVLQKLDMLRPQDTPEQDALFFDVTKSSIDVIALPMLQDKFYFGDKAYAAQLMAHGESIFNDKSFRNDDALRGSKHGIYLHRTFLGLFTILQKLDVTLTINRDFISKL